jgi:hypothetical protein
MALIDFHCKVPETKYQLRDEIFWNKKLCPVLGIGIVADMNFYLVRTTKAIGFEFNKLKESHSWGSSIDEKYVVDFSLMKDGNHYTWLSEKEIPDSLELEIFKMKEEIGLTKFLSDAKEAEKEII